MALRLDVEPMLSRPSSNAPAKAPNPERRARGKRYSRYVGMMKVTLPAVAAALLGLLVLWPRIEGARVDHSGPDKSQPGVGAIDTSTMKNPRYFGTDDNNRPFTVTAKSASQIDPKDLSVGLEQPEANFTRPDGTGVVASAQHGLYTQKANTLELTGDVSIYLDSGYELHTPSAHIGIVTGQVDGTDQFSAQGPTGQLSGQGFRIADRGGTVQCTGKCRAVLHIGIH